MSPPAAENREAARPPRRRCGDCKRNGPAEKQVQAVRHRDSIVTARSRANDNRSMVRSLRALLLFVGVVLSYGWHWLMIRRLRAAQRAHRWQQVHSRNARRVRSGFFHLRGLYIKLGQVLSVMAPFLPRQYAEELETLQDSVPPHSFGQIQKQLRAELGNLLQTHFRHVDPKPLAAASLAQVHRAQLTTGEEVVVKVLYPGIEQKIRSDIRVLTWLAPMLYRIFGFRNMDTVVAQLDQMLRHETDYEHERNNMERIRSMLGDHPRLVIPQVYPQLCTRRVLTMSYEAGVKLTNVQAMNELGIDRRRVADTLVEVYLRMLFEHQMFHADPHPGNLLVQQGDRLVFLDYGAVEPLSDPLMAGMKQVIFGALARNTEMVLGGIEAMGFVAESGDRELLYRVGREYLSTLADLRIDNFSKLSASQLEELSGVRLLRGRLRSVAASLRYPPGFFYVERTLALLFGVLAQLVPEQGLLGVAAPHASRLLLRSYAKPREPARADASG